MPKGVYERGAYKGKYKPGTQHDTPAGPITVLSVDAATCGRGQATRLVIRFNRTGAVREVQANNLSQGKVKDYMLPTVYGVGYIGSSLTIPQRGCSEVRRAYDLWCNMLRRVQRDTAYTDVTIDPRWLNFTQFLNSMDKLPGIEEWRAGADVHLDKDLRIPGSRTYGLDTCWFIPAAANLSKVAPE